MSPSLSKSFSIWSTTPAKYAALPPRNASSISKLYPKAKSAMLRVRDHGQGISVEAARRLFRPFSKSATEAANSAPGVGLGLALCRRLSRSIGGDLRFDAAFRAAPASNSVCPRSSAFSATASASRSGAAQFPEFSARGSLLDELIQPPKRFGVSFATYRSVASCRSCRAE